MKENRKLEKIWNQVNKTTNTVRCGRHGDRKKQRTIQNYYQTSISLHIYRFLGFSERCQKTVFDHASRSKRFRKKSISWFKTLSKRFADVIIWKNAPMLHGGAHFHNVFSFFHSFRAMGKTRFNRANRANHDCGINTQLLLYFALTATFLTVFSRYVQISVMELLLILILQSHGADSFYKGKSGESWPRNIPSIVMKFSINRHLPDCSLAIC